MLAFFQFFFFFNDTATTEIYTLSLHDALPICWPPCPSGARRARHRRPRGWRAAPCCGPANRPCRSEEHTSELQSQSNLVCRLLLEKKKNFRQQVDAPAKQILSPPPSESPVCAF